ncbi:MAG: hypothetical protein JNK82_28670 [Myxococcaceae bacterium]|nr:hypothetical protein [Myxococcaceae bacterium]
MPGLLLLVAVAAADPEPRVLEGEQALKALDYRAAATAFERACRDAPCTRAQLLRATTGLATALSSLAQTKAATEAFKQLLFISPEWRLPSGASPRIREPFEAAQVFWRSRAAPALSFRPSTLTANAAATQTVQLEADPLGLAARTVLVVRRPDAEQRLDGGARSALGDGGFAMTFELPAALTAPGPITFVAQALSPSGSVLLEATVERSIAGPVEPAPAPPPPVVEAPAPAEPGRALLHVSVTAVFDALNRALAAEALVSVSPLGVFDVALGAVLGAHPGLRLALVGHLPRTYRVSPFVALRGAWHPTVSALGGGLAGGVTLEAGPGRITASVAGELFSAPAAFSAASVLIFLGYELDVPGLRAD